MVILIVCRIKTGREQAFSIHQYKMSIEEEEEILNAMTVRELKMILAEKKRTYR